MNIFLSLTLYRLFFMESLIACFKFPIRNGEGSDGYTYVHNGGRSKRTSTYDRGGGDIFAILVHMY